MKSYIQLVQSYKHLKMYQKHGNEAGKAMAVFPIQIFLIANSCNI